MIKKLFPVALLIWACSQSTNDERLPIFGHTSYQENDTIYHTIQDFQLMDQDSSVITNESLANQIYVADFFFTSCPTICPTMKSQLLRVYEKYEGNAEVSIVSHTIDPEYDTIPLLKDYADRLGVKSEQWKFLWGDMDFIYELAEKSYMSIAREQFMPLKSRKPIPRKFSPGSEWVYYKVYCGERTGDTLLQEMVEPTVKQLLAENLIDEWFFIRYYDNNPHLRFRVHLKDQSSFGAVVHLISGNLQPFEDQKLVWKTELSGYEREMNRYGHDTIEESEKYFFHDSQAVLKILNLENQTMDQDIRWKYGLKAIDDTLEAFHLNDEQRLIMVEKYRDAFMEQFNVDKKAKYELDLKYRKYQSDIQELLNNDEYQEQLGLKTIAEARFDEISQIAERMLEIREEPASEWLPGLVGSMIHMTVNRLMTSRQRFYEMIMYYFMAKYYKSKIARAKKIKSVA